VGSETHTQDSQEGKEVIGTVIDGRVNMPDWTVEDDYDDEVDDEEYDPHGEPCEIF